MHDFSRNNLKHYWRQYSAKVQCKNRPYPINCNGVAYRRCERRNANAPLCDSGLVLVPILPLALTIMSMQDLHGRRLTLFQALPVVGS
jgi:hypothetical protein